MPEAHLANFFIIRTHLSFRHLRSRSGVQVGTGLIDAALCICVDERGAGEWIEGVRRGTPGDFWKMAEASDNTLVIPTK